MRVNAICFATSVLPVALAPVAGGQSVEFYRHPDDQGGNESETDQRERGQHVEQGGEGGDDVGHEVPPVAV